LLFVLEIGRNEGKYIDESTEKIEEKIKKNKLD